MKAKKTPVVSELEGAVLLEIDRMKTCSTYGLRQVFRDCPTLEWRASAGTIYPIVKRFIERRLIQAKTVAGDGRKTESLSLTVHGQQTLSKWVADEERCISAGQDPFRLRAPLLLVSRGKARDKLFRGLENAIKSRLEFFRQYAKSTTFEDTIRTEMGIELQKSRLKWLRKHRKE